VEDIFEEAEKRLRKKYYGWEGAKHFKGTGHRLVRACEELCWTNEKIKTELEKCFGAAYVDNYDELLVEGPIEVWTLCPHHLLPCRLTVHIGYIPNELVLGLSKFVRIAIILGKRPVIQEMYTRELANEVQKHLDPKGIGISVTGVHGCMRTRGVRQNANVTTSVLTGIIENRLEVRAEFYDLVRREK